MTAWPTRVSIAVMACKGSGVQISSAPPQVRGPSGLDHPRIARLRQQIGSNLF
jgi:hypothetical protein